MSNIKTSRDRCAQHKCRTSLRSDLRAVITLLVTVLVFGLAYLKVVLKLEGADIIAPWAASALTLVLQGYYMTKGAEQHARALRSAESNKEREEPCPHCTSAEPK